MEDKIIISAINPIGFSEFRPDLYYNYSHNPFECYAQKFENKDKTFMQILSKVDIEEVNLIRIDDNNQEKSYSITRIGTANLSDRTLSFTTAQRSDSDYDVYKVDLEFMGLLEGHYYIEVVPKDEITKYSELIYVKQKWEGTLWIEYKNSLDHGGFMFRSVDPRVGIRVDGTIREFLPGSNDNIYLDQVHNPTTLSSNPFRGFTLFIGGNYGVADYIADIINRVMTCDEVFIDGTQFNKTEGSAWDMTQDPDIPFQSMSMPIQAIDPTMNYTFKSLNISTPGDEIKPLLDWVIQRRNVNKTESSDFAISNIIEDKTTLDYITIYKHSASPYLLRVGTSQGAKDILETLVSDSIETLHLRQNFSAPTTLYFTGISEEQDFHVVYEKLNKKLEQSRATDESNLSSLQKNMVMLYGGTIDEFAIDFDPNTGLGRVNGIFEGFAVCDGRNGTINYINAFAYGWDLENGQIGDVVGSNEITLTQAQLPKINLKWKFANGARNDLHGGRDGVVYTDMATRANRPENDSPIDRFPIEEIGGDQPIDIRPKRVLSIYIQKIN